MQPTLSISALLLAGARNAQDPVAQIRGVSNKVLAKVSGKPMILRVLHSLESAATIQKMILCGPSSETVTQHSFLQSFIESKNVYWVSPGQGPSLSVEAVLDRCPEDLPLLITTADHALLTPEMIDYFVRQASQESVDVAVGLVAYPLVLSAYPGAKRTVLRFNGEGFCGCNLFMFFTPNARKLVTFWSQVEQERKHPLRLIRRLGVMALIRYLLGRLTLREALNHVGRRLDVQIKEVLLPFPEAAIDVDSPSDLELVEQILSQRERFSERGF